MKATLLVQALAFACTIALPTCSHGQTRPPLLQPANSLSSSTHVILTVPLAAPDAPSVKISEIEAKFGVKLAAEWPLLAINVHCFVIDASMLPDIDDLIVRMQADGGIRSAQKMQDFITFESSSADPLLPAQTALRQMNIRAAQRISKGKDVKVAVIDTAIDATHQDLTARVTKQQDFTGSGSASSGEPHGTAMAGIIAAEAMNGTGISGVAPEAALAGLRACWQDGRTGRCNSFSLARALNAAMLGQTDVINMSLGGPPDTLLGELVQAAIGKGIIIVAAAGETGMLAFPASVPGVIAAGPAQEAISAPSVDVLSTATGGRYRYVSGSSAASAHAAGVAALLRAARPNLSPKETAQAMREASGSGMLDACRALQAVVEEPVDCSR